MAENVPESRPKKMPQQSGAEPGPAAAGAAVPKARTPDAAEVSRPRKRAQEASAKPTKAAKASKPAKPTKAAKATETTKPAKPAKAAKATETTKPAKAAKAADAAKPAKAAKTTKAAAKASKATKAAAKSTAEPAAPVSQPVPAAPGAWARAAWEAVREPEQPPQRLAELAVAELGPRAAAWAQWLRQTYPAAPADGLARLATRQAVRQVRAVNLAGIGGPATIPFTVSSDAWVRATVVLRIAAAYGRDPADPARVSELLELTGLAAEAGGGPEHPGQTEQPTHTGGRISAYLRRLSQFRPASVAASPRRPLSVLALLAGVAESGYGVERLAHRAVRFYRPGSQSSTSASARSTSSPKIP